MIAPYLILSALDHSIIVVIVVEQMWNLWSERRETDLVDDYLGSAFREDEAMICLRVALLYIQDRCLLMSSVINNVGTK